MTHTMDLCIRQPGVVFNNFPQCVKGMLFNVFATFPQSVAFQSVVAERVCTGCPECITDLNGIGMLTKNLTYLLCSDFNAP